MTYSDSKNLSVYITHLQLAFAICSLQDKVDKMIIWR